ncbi:MAG TPA: heat-inducible transcriptional repressor HrcA [Terriglobales bacterium]|nr:heat-inducible transcriptional repressor HrcA [Terriglobales bacterium]
MTPPANVGARERQILTAIVKTYITTGEPVGSRTVARDNADGLSPATIRNVMSDLTEAGFLEQPHTSAGRVPTASAYRYFVEQLTGETHLSRADEHLIQDNFRGVTDLQEFMERTSHVLSLVSGSLGVVVAAGAKSNALEHVHFSRLSAQKILAVVVMRSGLVRDRVLLLEQDLPQADLDTAAGYINQNFHGWTIEALRTELARRIEEERSEYDRMMQSVEQLYRRGALGAEESGQVYVEGAANLVASEEDRARLQQLLQMLEEKQRVADLLGAYLDARQEAVRVVIGLEKTLPEMRHLVLIGAPARVGNEVMGSLAVIGPTRMDYEHTINAVTYIAQLFDKILNDER